ncbi:MAG: hypothetical protein LBF38_12125 [Deltaproteobacteria bacterium]|jgi:transposase|nr:hypothetical protein [Deltaproteobacteria bacterium]
MDNIYTVNLSSEEHGRISDILKTYRLNTDLYRKALVVSYLEKNTLTIREISNILNVSPLDVFRYYNKLNEKGFQSIIKGSLEGRVSRSLTKATQARLKAFFGEYLNSPDSSKKMSIRKLREELKAREGIDICLATFCKYMKQFKQSN